MRIISCICNATTSSNTPKTRVHSRIAIAGVFILLLAAGVSAQTFRGTILGTVTDPNGAVVAGSKVTIRNTNTGLERSTTTDDAGNYTVAELPIGLYEVRVEQTGFVPALVSNVTVEIASERRVDVKLTVAGADTVVTVATNVQVETTTNTLGGTVTARSIADLPVNGRDFTKFLVMVPGATGDPSGATDSPGSFGLFSANGNRGRANNYLLDGTDMNDGYRNIAPSTPDEISDAVPPNSCIRLRTIASPRPVPLWRVVKKGSQIRSRKSGETPEPLS